MNDYAVCFVEGPKGGGINEFKYLDMVVGIQKNFRVTKDYRPKTRTH